jgi:alpha-ketoglutarate-dependent taurine dioxygenase
MPKPSKQIEKLIQSSDLRQQVCEQGWLHFRASGPENSLATETLGLAKLLGEPISGRGGLVVEALVPQTFENANANSLSKQHGIGKLPLHIDGAHRLHPPQFVVFACVRPGQSPVPTILARFHDLKLSYAERQRCESAVFVVRNGRRTFYSTILSHSRPFIRFDEGCMLPVSPDGRQALQEVSERAAEIKQNCFNWQFGDILVVDNWRVLHGRGVASSLASLDRCILRVAIQ